MSWRQELLPLSIVAAGFAFAAYEAWRGPSRVPVHVNIIGESSPRR